jgi:butyrate kinase
MKELNTHPLTDTEQIGSHAAIKRAALRARELARQMNTPCYVIRDAQIVDVLLENGQVAGKDKRNLDGEDKGV